MISLKSKITKKLLETFFLNEKDSFYANEVARKIGEDPSNVYKKLIELKSEGLLLDEFRGKERYFFINKKYPFIREYKRIVLKGVGFEKIIKEYFESIDGVESVYIFGSYASGKFSEESDIDVLVVGDFDFNQSQKALLEIQKRAGREVNAVELSKDDFSKRVKDKDPLLEDIFSRKNIKLI